VRYVIVDCGSVGLELARRWTDAGHQVVGTSPDPAQLSRIGAVCTEALLLSHGDGDRIREVVADAESAVLAARPRFLYTQSPRERVTAYRRSMISVVRAAASIQRRVVLFSSIVVYGDGGPGDGPVTEQTPVTTSLDPAAQSFAAVERIVLESPQATVLRLPEAVIGHPDDPDAVAVLRAMHQEVGGALPFDAAALIHVIDYRDAAAAVAFAVEHHLTGVYNVVPDTVMPPTAEAFIGKLAADAGLPPFTFAGELTAPTRPVSSAKLRAAGFTFAFTHA
jgi:nucleoside-diphosphate-sugar epimerase